MIINAIKKIAIILSILTCTQPYLSQAMEADFIANPNDIKKLKTEMEKRKTDTLVIGGSHRRVPGWKSHWILSGENCLTVNTDDVCEPDFLADGFDLKDLNINLSPLFDIVHYDNETYGLSAIKYEHVGYRLDPNTAFPIFQKLFTLFKRNIPGHFEFTSSWMNLQKSINPCNNLLASCDIDLISFENVVTDHFSKTADSLEVNLTGTHKHLFRESSPLFDCVNLLKTQSNLSNISVFIDKIDDIYCYAIKGHHLVRQ